MGRVPETGPIPFHGAYLNMWTARAYVARGHLDKSSSEGSVRNISFIMANWSWLWRVTSGNPERLPHENVTMTKSRRSPETDNGGWFHPLRIILPGLINTDVIVS